MFKLDCNIQIGKLQFDFVHQCTIQHSMKVRTATATIVLPKNVQIKTGDIQRSPLQGVLKSGDKVTIQLGYNGQLNTEFIGYVRTIKPDAPMQVICEDDMYLLKRKTIAPKTIAGKISDVLNYIAPEYTHEILDSNLNGSFVIDATANTALKVLDALEQVYGLKSFFRLVNGSPVLTVGRLFSASPLLAKNPVKYELHNNLESHNLELQSADDVQVKVEVKSKQDKGKILQNVFKGDDDGELRSFAAPYLSQAQIESIAKELYNGAKTDRFKGSLTTFGIPYITAGMAVHITTNDFEIKETTNIIDAAEVTFGVNGFRRTIELGYKTV
jgi:hypothetical protein